MFAMFPICRHFVRESVPSFHSSTPPNLDSHSTAQHSTAQYSTAQHSTAENQGTIPKYSLHGRTKKGNALTDHSPPTKRFFPLVKSFSFFSGPSGHSAGSCRRRRGGEGDSGSGSGSTSTAEAQRPVPFPRHGSFWVRATETRRATSGISWISAGEAGLNATRRSEPGEERTYHTLLE